MQYTSLTRRKLIQTIGTATLATGTHTTATATAPSDTQTRDPSDAAPGDILWEFGPLDEPPGVINSSPTVVDGTVYVGSGSRRNRLHALDATTGEQQWSLQAGDAIHSAPAVTNGTVYVGDHNGIVRAADATTGEQLWTTEVTDRSIWGSPTVFDGTVYIGADNNRLYALDAVTGEQEWAFQGGFYFHASPAVANGTVYAPCLDNKFYAIDADTGNSRWVVDTESRMYEAPTIADGTVYVGTTTPPEQILAFDTATGEHTVLRDNTEGTGAGATVADGILYIPSNEQLLALELPSGELKWSYDTGDRVEASPTVVDNTVICATGGLIPPRTATYIFALDADTGEEKWRIEDNKGFNSSPVVVDGVAYIGGFTRRVYAINVDSSRSSRGSRILNGAENHHYGWDAGPVTTSKLSGVVTDTQQTPLSEATVALTTAGTTVATDTTDTKGEFTVEPAPGTYTLSVDRDGFTRQTTTVTLDQGVPVRKRLALTPLDPGTITGTVTAPEGSSVPVTNVSVRVLSAGTTVVEAETLTDETGAYSIEVPPGEYRVIVSTNEASGWQDVTVAEADTVTAPLALTDGLIPFPGRDNPPQDLDDDGRVEDITGDGEFTIFDVQEFFTYFQSDQVQQNPEPFNFSNSSSKDITIFDVQALFLKLAD